MTKKNAITNLLSLEEIVKGNLFKIPDYQRGYSWEEEQLNDLLKDIEHIEKKNHRHYTGTIVITKNDLGKYEIVDGQQRLTSLIILLKLIYDSESEKFKSILETFVLRKNGDYVLETNSDTQHYFREAILGDKKNLQADIKSKQNLIFAKKHFKKWLKKQENQEHVYNTVIEKLGFICYSPENTNEIGIMFEVINNRGKALSELEKIKNYFIYYATIHSSRSLKDKINHNWVTLLRHLSEAGITSNEEENKYLRNCYIVFYSTNKQKSWYVYDELKELYKPEDIENLSDKLEEICEFIDFIEQAAQSYAFLMNDDTFKNSYKGNYQNEISIALKRLRCHPVNASIMPLYISTMAYLFEKPEEVCELLQLIEKVNFRIYVIPNTKIARADSKQGDLFNWANELYWDSEWHTDQDEEPYYTWRERKIEGDIFRYVAMNLEDFVQVLCPEEVFIQSLTLDLDEPYDYYQWNGLRFFLASYEEWLNENRKESWDIEKILITREEAKKKNRNNDYLSKEHIWARANRNEDFSHDHREKRRLGNFVLLGLASNIQLQADDLEDKVELLIEKSSISMMQVSLLSKYIEQATYYASQYRAVKNKNYYWAQAAKLIDIRETELIKFALNRWKLKIERFTKFDRVDSFEAKELGKNEYYFLKK